jgi:hypothetical protein
MLIEYSHFPATNYQENSIVTHRIEQKITVQIFTPITSIAISNIFWLWINNEINKLQSLNFEWTISILDLLKKMD